MLLKVGDARRNEMQELAQISARVLRPGRRHDSVRTVRCGYLIGFSISRSMD
jgi:hypothetical protein